MRTALLKDAYGKQNPLSPNFNATGRYWSDNETALAQKNAILHAADLLVAGQTGAPEIVALRDKLARMARPFTVDGDDADRIDWAFTLLSGALAVERTEALMGHLASLAYAKNLTTAAFKTQAAKDFARELGKEKDKLAEIAFASAEQLADLLGSVPESFANPHMVRELLVKTGSTLTTRTYNIHNRPLSNDVSTKNTTPALHMAAFSHNWLSACMLREMELNIAYAALRLADATTAPEGDLSLKEMAKTVNSTREYVSGLDDLYANITASLTPTTGAATQKSVCKPTFH